MRGHRERDCLGGSPDIHATGWFIENQQAWLDLQPFRKHNLLLIASTEVAHWRINAGRFDSDEAHSGVCALTFLPFIKNAKTVGKSRKVDAVNVPLDRVLKR